MSSSRIWTLSCRLPEAQAGSLQGAVKHIEEVMGGTMIDYVIASLQETQIMDVYEHHAQKKNSEERNDVPEYEQNAE